eukprot:TRINITY_DN1008_c0_g2_i1.p2 TRINITY_DN1008_c0_g2~~TRINITY_DN1008_c0_g2_i1.p2  ORF type:complete len:259 (-),score=31.96 TRINITY_DN1008_c0_g2_i1:213-989(-)
MFSSQKFSLVAVAFMCSLVLSNGRNLKTGFASVYNVGEGFFNIVDPLETDRGFSFETPNSNFDAVPNAAFSNATLATGVTTQAGRNFEQATKGNQTVLAVSDNAISLAGTLGQAGGVALVADGGLANITQFTTEASQAVAIDGASQSITAGRLGNLARVTAGGIQVLGSLQSQTQNYVPSSTPNSVFNIASGATYNTNTTIIGFNGELLSQGQTGSVSTNQGTASGCTGGQTAQVGGGSAFIQSDCSLSSGITNLTLS